MKFSVYDQVARVAINRADLHNAFNETLIRELTEAFTAAGDDAEARVVVLAAGGKHFCAGADLNWMKKMVGNSFEENAADAKLMARMFRSISECPKPVIARVHGSAFGGGVGLVAACDMAVALAGAQFALTEVKVGILPATILPFLVEKTGPGILRRYALTSEPFDAHEAKRIGLVSEVAGTLEELDEKVAMLCKSVKGNSPKAVSAFKRILQEFQGSDMDKVQDSTSKWIAEIRVSPEGQEGLKAFLEKRKPKWLE